MSDLTDFLLARIAEDAAVARRAAEIDAAQPPEYRPAEPISLTDDFTWGQSGTVEMSAARFLAECEAKRRIVAQHRLSPDPEPDDDWLGICTMCTDTGPEAQGWPCDTLKALASVYAEHPDYREEWRPAPDTLA